MDTYFQNKILEFTQATSLQIGETIQSLWSGYGKIVRVHLQGSKYNSVVVKHVRLPKGGSHPRGWNTDLSHQRKVKSYEVETAFYENFSSRCEENCRIPICFGVDKINDEVLMVLEDLDDSGYGARVHSVNWTHINSCLVWLANFHATFLHKKPTNLWPIGTYWHLDTRPDELKVMNDKALRKAAPAIDKTLNEANFLTFVHGDAKLANFCFSESGDKVSAVDFQYVGGGCGMKDVAYFVGSCLYENDCESMEQKILACYFEALTSAVKKIHPDIDTNELEKEWRDLYPVAWTDFHRFLKGWSPDHWKINSYSERMARQVLKQL